MVKNDGFSVLRQICWLFFHAEYSHINYSRIDRNTQARRQQRHNADESDTPPAPPFIYLIRIIIKFIIMYATVGVTSAILWMPEHQTRQ